MGPLIVYGLIAGALGVLSDSSQEDEENLAVSGATYGIASPYAMIVGEVIDELTKKHGRNRFQVDHFLNHRLGRAETRIGGPAPMMGPIRQAVHGAMRRHARDSHTSISEGRTSPGAIGEGWYMRLVEEPVMDHVH